MFDDDAGRFLELPDAFERRIAVGNIVVRKRFTLQLLRCGESPLDMHLVAIESSILVRIFAIPQFLDEVAGMQEIAA